MYITLNRKSEWERALLIGMHTDGHVLRGAEGTGSIADNALMITGAIDSFEHDHVWDRIYLDMELAPDTNCRVSCFASDSTKQEIGGDLVEFDAWINSEGGSAELKVNQSEYLFKPVPVQNGDGLLGCRGRYLWLRLDIITGDRAALALRAIKLSLPDEHITDYLPEIYMRGLTATDFFPRFMSVFDSIFFDLEDDIGRIAEKLDYRTGDADMLAYQAKWLAISEPAVNAERLRSQIRSAVDEYKKAGTKEGLISAVKEQTGFEPIVVEHFSVEKMTREGPGRHTYSKLFGSNPYKVCILLPEEALSSREKISGLISRIRSCVPAHVTFEIVPLRDNVMLDRHTYLEVNSNLSDYSGIIVEEKSTLHHDIYIGGNLND